LVESTVILCSAIIFLNASVSIVVTVLGIVIVVIAQLSNALAPILVTKGGIVILVRA
jgi:hypothetical protein